MSDRTDWIARIYDEEEEVIDVWYVHDRTEKEARDEVEADITRLLPGRDWTLSRAENLEGGQIKVNIVGEIWIEAHAEAVHDVLFHDVRYALMNEWDFEKTERAVAEAVYDHLAKKGVTDIEIELFEQYLDSQGCEMVEVNIDVK